MRTFLSILRERVQSSVAAILVSVRIQLRPNPYGLSGHRHCVQVRLNHIFVHGSWQLLKSRIKFFAIHDCHFYLNGLKLPGSSPFYVWLWKMHAKELPADLRNSSRLKFTFPGYPGSPPDLHFLYSNFVGLLQEAKSKNLKCRSETSGLWRWKNHRWKIEYCYNILQLFLLFARSHRLLRRQSFTIHPSIQAFRVWVPEAGIQ